MHCLEAALKIAPEDMKKKINENLAVIYNDYAKFSFGIGRSDAEEFFEKSLEMNSQYVAGHYNYAIFLRNKMF